MTYPLLITPQLRNSFWPSRVRWVLAFFTFCFRLLFEIQFNSLFEPIIILNLLQVAIAYEALCTYGNKY